ncbi:Uncharacterized conserved protein [Salmonella enterica subsp. salamae]|uniref:Uncharacterized conserved protein n=1 Tax=Salmonella enterica subsp. salamae TaxID=59202 RepID=A0A6D2GC88_SALER|nr:Uncharacterized conserved protein [Salmonella enterica subsp. salamae]
MLFDSYYFSKKEGPTFIKFEKINMPTAARLNDKGTQHDGYYETVIIAGSATVFIDGLPAARTGGCGGLWWCANWWRYGEYRLTVCFLVNGAGR